VPGTVAPVLSLPEVGTKLMLNLAEQLIPCPQDRKNLWCVAGNLRGRGSFEVTASHCVNKIYIPRQEWTISRGVVRHEGELQLDGVKVPLDLSRHLDLSVAVKRQRVIGSRHYSGLGSIGQRSKLLPVFATVVLIVDNTPANDGADHGK
jgi:hypothetical protein